MTFPATDVNVLPMLIVLSFEFAKPAPHPIRIELIDEFFIHEPITIEANPLFEVAFPNVKFD